MHVIVKVTSLIVIKFVEVQQNLMNVVFVVEVVYNQVNVIVINRRRIA